MSSARSCVLSSLLLVAIAAIAACGRAQEPAKSAPPTVADATVPPDITDADIPPVPQPPFAAAAPMDVVRAVYTFAARHPEVLNQVPCFCGCESRGHRHNDDCFVKARDARGRPTEWELHGVG